MRTVEEIDAHLSEHEQIVLSLREERSASLAIMRLAFIREAQDKIQELAVTVEDLFPGLAVGRASAPKADKAPPKYRNPLTGETWVGRGKAPRWITGKDKASFLIGDVQSPSVVALAPTGEARLSSDDALPIDVPVKPDVADFDVGKADPAAVSASDVVMTPTREENTATSPPSTNAGSGRKTLVLPARRETANTNGMGADASIEA